MRRLFLAFALLAAACALVSAAASASDHADPIFNKKPDAGLTGLFVFPVIESPGPTGEQTEPVDPEATNPTPGHDATDEHVSGEETDPATAAADGEETRGPDELILILGIHPSLIAPGPYDLESFQYNIHIDHHSEIRFSDPADLARYGGTVVHPAGITADVTLSFRLNANAELTDTQVEGLDTGLREVVSGVYDDPFIFPRFFGKNIIAIAVRLPISALPADRQDFLFWGTTTEADSGEQVDHVGRSNRTQLPRFDFLNTVPPSEHVDVIHETAHKRQRVQNFLKRYPPPALWQGFKLLQAIRHYDYVPDVMIFSLRNEPGYPNGRRLEDDIVAISCSTGDCLLQETSFQESEVWPRITTNDKPFTGEFPYLAAPWPEKKPDSQPGCFFPTLIILLVLGLFAWLFLKIVCAICRRRSST
ncbi:MAG: DUF4331 domain-containing protein [Thermoanaerobaculia bacterium]|nr:DUF4331 domain-containing protein [Thermoanaerobaculia bacterium]